MAQSETGRRRDFPFLVCSKVEVDESLVAWGGLKRKDTHRYSTHEKRRQNVTDRFGFSLPKLLPVRRGLNQRLHCVSCGKGSVYRYYLKKLRLRNF
jgi:hypothetical protein